MNCYQTHATPDTTNSSTPASARSRRTLRAVAKKTPPMSSRGSSPSSHGTDSDDTLNASMRRRLRSRSTKRRGVRTPATDPLGSRRLARARSSGRKPRMSPLLPPAARNARSVLNCQSGPVRPNSRRTGRRRRPRRSKSVRMRPKRPVAQKRNHRSKTPGRASNRWAMHHDLSLVNICSNADTCGHVCSDCDRSTRRQNKANSKLKDKLRLERTRHKAKVKLGAAAGVVDSSWMALYFEDDFDDVFSRLAAFRKMHPFGSQPKAV